MRLDKFTSKFQEAIADAQSLALGRDQQFIEPVHLMFALLNQEGGTVRELLNKLAINFNELRSKVSQSIDKLPRVEGEGANLQLSSATAQLLQQCDKLAQKRAQAVANEILKQAKGPVRVDYFGPVDTTGFGTARTVEIFPDK